jgi:para-nitrobenzyl esterase
MRRAASLRSAAWICSILALACTAQAQTIGTDTGKVAGKTLSSGVHAWLGIPFAQPPLRDLRWHDPVPVKPWTGTYEATTVKLPCAQVPFGSAPGTAVNTAQSSEDCLYLYVWTPAEAKPGDKIPVIVYIHGGGFTSGSPGSMQNTGEDLAKKGVVVATIGYRLGVFGFFAHPELTKESAHHASGDFGNLDQVEGLQWLHRNIAAFGGDPANVTITGQSAGSESIYQLMASPLCRGLFAKVSGWSGADLPPGGRAPDTLAQGEALGIRLQQALDAKSISEMRALPWDKVLEAANSGAARIQTRPVVDGYFLPDLPDRIFKTGKQNDLPLYTSSTQEDLGSAMQFYDNVHTVADLKKYASETFGDAAGEFLRLFPAANDDDARTVALMVSADTGFGVSNRDWARDQVLKGRQPAYLAQWAHIPPRAPGGVNRFGVGPSHGSDIVYWLGTLGHQTNRTWSDWDREVSDKMQDTLVAFARTGNPNTSAVKVPRYDPKNEQRVVFGEGKIYIDKLNTEQIEFLRAHAPARGGGGRGR